MARRAGGTIPNRANDLQGISPVSGTSRAPSSKRTHHGLIAHSAKRQRSGLPVAASHHGERMALATALIIGSLHTSLYPNYPPPVHAKSPTV